MKSVCQETCTPTIHCSTFQNTKVVETSECPSTDKWKCGTHTKWNVISSLKKNKILLFATIQMELEIIMLSKINQAQNDNLHMWNTENQLL